MIKKVLCAIAALLAMMLSFSSCSDKAVSLSESESPDTLSFEIPSMPTPGLLNPDAEVRGIWIASVGNINFPSRQGLSVNALKHELDDIVANCTELGLNTIFFQVRPSADALYNSKLFPTSEYLTGTQGKKLSGNFDCLEYLTHAAHEAKIRVHAWVNPLRVTYGSAKYPKTDLSYLAKDHIARKNSDWVIPYADGKLYFDAGIPEVRQYIAEGVKEIVLNYSVDGIVFDDYFYPYPVKGAEFDDSESYGKYGEGTLEDWRRENINALVKGCYEAVKEVRSECLFGISPFGIWQNDDGRNGGSQTTGLEAYESLYCDATAWAQGGYVDYIAPQLYWRFTTKAAPYGILSDWWNSVLDGTGVDLLICHGVYMYDQWDAPGGELKNQIEYSRNAICYKGSVLYGYKAVTENFENIREEIRKVFSSEIIYSDYYSTSAELEFSGIPESGETSENEITIYGSSDPAVTLAYGEKRISRERDGSFVLTVPIKKGENLMTFDYGDKKIILSIMGIE